MVRLVSPDLKLHIVTGPQELRELVRVLGLDRKLGGNLRQLCGWEAVGTDRSGRYHAENWQPNPKTGRFGPGLRTKSVAHDAKRWQPNPKNRQAWARHAQHAQQN